MIRTSSASLAVLLAGGLAIVATPAHARVVESGTFHDEFQETFDDFCDVEGLTVAVDTEVRGRFRLVARGSGRDPYFAQRVKVAQTFTNPETGEYVTARENTLSKDLEVTRDGDLLTITVLATGNYTIFDADGKAIARNPGQTRFQVVIDDNGTPEDSSDDEEVSFEIVKPSTGRTDDSCEAIVGAIG